MSSIAQEIQHALPRTYGRLSRHASRRLSRPGSRSYRISTISSVNSESTEELAPNGIIDGLQAVFDEGFDFRDHAAIPEQLEPQHEPGSHTGADEPSTPQLNVERPFGIRWAMIVCAILINIFIYAVDNTIVAIIQPAIVQQYGDLSNLPWVSVGFMMAGTATALPMSGLFGVFDAKMLYLIFTVIFVGASGLCCFYIDVIIGALSLPLVFILTPSFRPRPAGASIITSLRSIDWLGAGISLPAFVLAIMAISFGGTEFAWESPAIVSFFWASGLLFFLFWGDSALEAGVKLLPLVSFLVATIVLNGHLMAIWGHHQVWIVLGSVLVLISGVFFARLNSGSTDATLWGLQVVLGIGTGAFSQAGFSIAQAMVGPAEIQNAISFMLIAQLSGTSLGLSLCGAIFQNRSIPLVADILGPGYSHEDAVRIVSNIDPELTRSLSPELTRRVRDIVIQAVDDGFALLYVGGALCLLCGIFLTPNRHLVGGGSAKQSSPMGSDETKTEAIGLSSLGNTMRPDTTYSRNQLERATLAAGEACKVADEACNVTDKARI
ncbi:hypothetical protein VPNG_09782 [Cytospora leucostoma]|uniref:Major facilitator superfamily (MFS) profile domain-containing protein n=1 Tax=Cytospora leucostoma TaxID=1230097 RepID=A0A423VGW2_9PEZI|nr:hypothetical protein VPNG_09782 [Cytospora leucostoma]